MAKCLEEKCETRMSTGGGRPPWYCPEHNELNAQMAEMVAETKALIARLADEREKRRGK